MTGVHVVLTNKFLGQLDALAIRVGFSVPPSVLIEGPKGVHKHNLTAGTKGEFFLPVHVN